MTITEIFNDLQGLRDKYPEAEVEFKGPVTAANSDWDSPGTLEYEGATCIAGLKITITLVEKT